MLSVPRWAWVITGMAQCPSRANGHCVPGCAPPRRLSWLRPSLLWPRPQPECCVASWRAERLPSSHLVSAQKLPQPGLKMAAQSESSPIPSVRTTFGPSPLLPELLSMSSLMARRWRMPRFGGVRPPRDHSRQGHHGPARVPRHRGSGILQHHSGFPCRC